MSKILIIEDDRTLVDVLAYNLRQAGYEVDVAYDGLDGLSGPPEIIYRRGGHSCPSPPMTGTDVA